MNHGAVFGQAITKTLVGHVQERHQCARLANADHLVPLGRRDVIAGRVMAAGMQNCDASRGSCGQVSQHAIKVNTPRAGVVVAVVFNHKSSAAEEGTVVFPAGIGDQHIGTGTEFFQEICPDFQATRAANGLHRGDSTRLDRLAAGAKHQRLDARVIGCYPVNG